MQVSKVWLFSYIRDNNSDALIIRYAVASYRVPVTLQRVSDAAMGGGSSVPAVSPALLLADVEYDPRIGSVTEEEAIEAIALAFCGSETVPKEELIHWILGPRWAAFDSPERMSVCRYNGKFAVASCSKKGSVLGLRDPSTREVLGVLLLRRTPETTVEMMRTMKQAGAPPHMKTKVYGKEPLKRDGAVEKAMKKLAHRGPQYVLYALAVKPAHQGKGYASALVRALKALADRDGLPVCVDCVGERLEAIYGHLGFEVQQRLEVIDPTKQEGSAPISMTSMMRPAKRDRQASTASTRGSRGSTGGVSRLSLRLRILEMQWGRRGSRT